MVARGVITDSAGPTPIEPLRLGALTVEFPVALAPMAGYTDAAMRVLARRYGCGFTFTEVVNAEALVRGSKPTFHLLETLPDERPVGAHLYGREPGVMAEAAAAAERLGRFDFIDINCGCPVRKIMAKGCGAALMRDPDRIGRIVAAVAGAVSLPVTVKTRIGLSPSCHNISEIAHAVEAAGAALLSIHARYVSSGHRGPADWQALAAVKRERSIAIMGNGGINVAADALRMLRETGVDGVMIGRAAVGNPWIFAEIRRLLYSEACEVRPAGMRAFASRRRPVGTEGQASPPIGPDEAVPAEFRSVIAEHLETMVRLHDMERAYRRRSSLPAEQSAALHFRGHLHQYLKGFAGWGAVRRELQGLNTPERIMAAVDTVLAGPGKRGGHDDA